MTESLKKRARLRTAICVLALALCAHAFCFVNLTQSGQAVRIDLRGFAAESYASLNWLRPFYYRLLGGIALPFLSGVLGCVFLVFICLGLAHLLRAHTPLCLFLICGVMTLHPSVTALFAERTGTADATLLACLLCLCGVLASVRGSSLSLLAVPCFAAAFGLDVSCLSVPLLLLVLLKLERLCGGGNLPVRALHPAGISYVLACALTLAAGLFFIRRNGVDAALQPSFSALPAFALAALRSNLLPFSAYPRLSPVLLILTALSVFALPASGRLPRRIALLFPAALLLCAVLSVLPFCVSARMPQVHVSFALLLLTAVPVLNHADRAGRLCSVLRGFLTGALCALFLGQIVFANQVYLKKSLEFQSTLSVMTRVLDRLEETDGFSPGSTPVAILGSPDQSPLSVPHEGFEHLEAFDAASHHFAIYTEAQTTVYVWQILGYPLNLVSDHEKSLLRDLPEVRLAPLFPAEGSVFRVGETLVVKLS